MKGIINAGRREIKISPIIEKNNFFNFVNFNNNSSPKIA